MGKKYASEIQSVPETYEWARKVPIPALADFVHRSANISLIAVGSGGSMTAAEFASLQHVSAVSRAMTAEEFLETPVPNDCAVLLITAGGNNHDILAAYEKAIKTKVKVLGILCANASGKIVELASSNVDVFVHAVTPPTGRDGFLATNTLIATVVWIAMGWGIGLPEWYIMCKGYAGDLDSYVSDRLKNRNIGSLLVLHDSYGKPAALDAESKLHEAGLVSVQLADYRNFAHGRHNWIDKNPKTLVLALATSRNARLADATIEKIRGHARILYVNAGNITDRSVSIRFLIMIFHIVGFFGKTRLIDPGRPGPPQFGRDLYHMDVSKYMDFNCW